MKKIICEGCKHCISLRIKDNIIECDLKELDYIPDYCRDYNNGKTMIDKIFGIFD